MTIRKLQSASRPLLPDEVYRGREVEPFLGMGQTAIYDMIKRGEFPAPIKLRKYGRAKGWFGSMIIDYQKKVKRGV